MQVILITTHAPPPLDILAIWVMRTFFLLLYDFSRLCSLIFKVNVFQNASNISIRGQSPSFNVVHGDQDQYYSSSYQNHVSDSFNYSNTYKSNSNNGNSLQYSEYPVFSRTMQSLKNAGDARPGPRSLTGQGRYNESESSYVPGMNIYPAAREDLNCSCITSYTIWQFCRELKLAEFICIRNTAFPDFRLELLPNSNLRKST